MNASLNYVPGSLEITLNRVTLPAFAYTVDEAPGTSGGTLKLVFDTGQLAQGDLVIKIKTIINQTAVVNVPIPNTARLDYNNGMFSWSSNKSHAHI